MGLIAGVTDEAEVKVTVPTVLTIAMLSYFATPEIIGDAKRRQLSLGF